MLDRDIVAPRRNRADSAVRSVCSGPMVNRLGTRLPQHPARMKKTAIASLIIAIATYAALQASSTPRAEYGPPSSDALSRADELSLSTAHYVGVEACADCHADKAETYVETTHYLAMRPATDDSVLGHFADDGRNTYHSRRPELRYEMTVDDGRYHQTSIEARGEIVDRVTRPIDLVMGSGKVAQAYFYWEGRALYQMPMIFFTPVGIWTNGPGFLDTWPRWNRGISARCLECHATYFEEVPGATDAYFRDTMVMEISCERCHGPGSAHTAYQEKHPDAEPRHIVDPRTLTRERHLEICSQCHGSIGKPKQPSFTFIPGERLSDYLEYDQDDETMALVHTVNQLQRLEQSRCFEASDMTCVSCHDPHAHERDQLAVFSARCMECHQLEQCGKHERLGASIAENCIDCHMPFRDDESTPFYLPAGDALKLMQLRDHRVAIYQDAAEQMEARWSEPGRDLDGRTRAARHARREILAAETAGAIASIEAGDFVDAVKRYRRALDLAPENLDVTLKLAWLLATAPEEQLRDGEQSLRLARAASDALGDSNWSCQEVLAAAFAETGQFEEAIDAVKRASALADSSDSVEEHDLTRLRACLALYEKEQPYRMTTAHD